MPAKSPRLLLLNGSATVDDLNAALAKAGDAKELFALLPGHLDAPEGLPAMVLSGVSERFAEQLEQATEAALRPKSISRQ